MKIIIIEDEKLTAKDLEDMILEVAPSSQIVATLYSVKQAVAYLSKNPAPDLIFSDIQLGDGLSFDIFNQVKVNTPIVFCTAYDEYARSEEHTSELQSRENLVCRLLLEKKKTE